MVMISITFALFIVIELSYRFFTPVEVRVSDEALVYVYRTGRTRTKGYDEILWMMIWSGGQWCSPYSAIKFDDGGNRAYPMSYEAGRDIRERFVRLYGRRPLNYDQYLEATNSLRWFTYGGRSE